ncbi:MAG: thermonuclease family protein [Candidatus Methanomethylicaceae archaeon]
MMWARASGFSWLVAILLFQYLTLADTYAVGTSVGCVVKEVLDGDTFKCIPEQKVHSAKVRDGKVIVRMYGIDAPERSQPYGVEARVYLRRLLKGKRVQLEVKEVDRYGRLVAVVYDGGRNINLEQVESGHAWAYLRYLDRPYVSQFYSAEERAREQRLGLWNQRNPTPPWEWRKSH